MKIFDTHSHVYPDKIAERVVAHLREQSQGIPAFTNGTYLDHKTKALEAGFAGWMNCPVATRAGQAVSMNEWAAQHNAWPSLSLGGVHPDDSDKEGIMNHILELGLAGIKFHPEYQSFSLLEPRMAPIWEFCQKKKVPVLIHAGSDIGFQPPYHSTPAAFVELARRYPELTIIAAHAGGWMNWDEVEECYGGSGLYIDTSFSMPYMQDRGQMLRIIRKIGVRHVLFGTDSPWQDLKDAANDIMNCGLTASELEDVFWNNAARIWHLDEYIK